MPFIGPTTPTIEAMCREIGKYPIGTPAPDEADPVVLETAARFAARSDELYELARSVADDPLVCGELMASFRNSLVTQTLYVGGQEYRTLVAGRRATDPVIDMTHNEFETFKFAPKGTHDRYNLVGVPLRREVQHGLPTIRTDAGAVVMVRADTIGVPVLYSAHTIWTRDGATMGVPVSPPWGTGTDARQSFANGYLWLEHAPDPFSAAMAPVEAYEWKPLAGNVVGAPLEAHSVVGIAGRSYYVGPDLQLHWLPSTQAWGCATGRLGAFNRGTIDATLVATLPLGKAFVCADWL